MGQHVRFMFHEPGQVARRQHAFQLQIRASDEHDAALFGEHHDRLPERRARRQHRKGMRDHHFIYPTEHLEMRKGARVICKSKEA